MVCASELIPVPASVAYIRAPRACANWVRSSTTAPPPSDMTKPSRALSNGRDAF